MGWKVDTNAPKESTRSVMIAAPHTSNWDGIIMVIAFYILDVPMRFAVKDSLTKFPMGLIVKAVGGLGINRKAKKPGEKRPSQVELIADLFKEHKQLALTIAPEGTRALREEWKMGFYHIAKLANVPITFGYLDYKRKVAGVGGILYPGDDIDADMKKILNFYKDITPKFPEYYSLDKRYLEKENKEA